MTSEAAALEDRSISLERANVLALALIPVIALVVFGLPLLLGGSDMIAEGWRRIANPLIFIPGFIATIIIHEGLHAAGFMLGGAVRENIHFGVDRGTGSPFAGCRVPLRAGAYRVAVVLPALLMGVLPWLVGIAIGDGLLVVVAFWMLAFAGGDLMILWLIRDLPAGTLVIDHPKRAGCQIVEDSGRGRPVDGPAAT